MGTAHRPGVDGTRSPNHAWKVIEISEQTALKEIEQRLTSEFPGLPPEAVGTAIKQAHARFDASRIRDFVPLFVERRARRYLITLGAVPPSRGRSPHSPGGRLIGSTTSFASCAS